MSAATIHPLGRSIANLPVCESCGQQPATRAVIFQDDGELYEVCGSCAEAALVPAG